MDRIKTIDNLINDYKDSDLSEADTRYKIIDTILQEILAWPKGPTTCEKFINGNYADYVLYKLNGKPALVIEAKKEGKYFNLINNNNSSAKLRMMKVDTLLTDKEIQTATLQVKSYCEDLGCDYGAICNGHQWIIFYFNPINTPWKSLQAIVITSIDYFKDSLTDAYNLLGYNSIVNHDSLRSSLGLKSIIHGEIFYPKSNITCYDMPVTNNRYAAAMQIIGRNFFSNIPPQDHEFMQQCYVSHRQYQDSIESGVKQIISDSLTPFFKIQGYKDIWDDKRGGAFGNRVAQIIRDENRQNVIILFGGRGSGKSTFIQRLLYFICPPEIKHFSEIVLINLINCTQNPDQLSNEIWSKICANIDVNGIISGDRNRLLDLFDDRFSIYKKQILIDLEPTSVEYQRLLSEFIINNKNDIKYCCIKLAQEIMSHQKGVIIVFDNMDHLGPELQDLCFLTANEVADKLACTVIVSMREERFYRAKSTGVLDAYHTNGFHLSSPIIKAVFLKRLVYTLKKLTNSTDLPTDYHINSNTDSDTIKSFLQICLKELRRDGSHLQNFLTNSTHGDVRQALDYLKSFFISGYTNIQEFASNINWKFQKHQILRPMMIPDRFFYDERYSNIPNVYQIRSEGNTSHFTMLRILWELNGKTFDRKSHGFIDAKYLIQEFQVKYDMKQDCISCLDVLLSKALVEASNRLDNYSQNVDQIRITPFGRFMLNNLCMEFTYLDLVSLDCGLYDEKLSNGFAQSALNEVNYFYANNFMDRIRSRLDRVDKFIEYLCKLEEREMKTLGLGIDEKRFTIELASSFKEEKETISHSADKKKMRELADIY